ncbi:hypothetical protein ACFLVR_03040 [Chloroflexota bacterium]
MKKLFAISIAAVLIINFFSNVSCICYRTKEQVLDDIISWVVDNRQLAALNDIEYEFIATADLRQKLTDDFEDENSRQVLETNQELLEMLGLIEDDDDLYSIYLDLYTEQIAGYYDPAAKKIYVISDEGPLKVSDMMTFAHEVTHALQDQHYDLTALSEQASDDSEYSMGITSLIEGDAVLTQGLYYWTDLNQRERDIYTQESEQTDSANYDATPRYLQESLVFPYTYGYEFVLQLYQSGGWDAVNAVYDDPPKSMEQIIHPDKYAAAENPITVALPDIETLLGNSWEIKTNGTVGEFDLKLILEAFITPSDDTINAAARWGGDKYIYLKHDTTDEKTLVVYSTWDAETDAQEFFDLYSDNKAGTDINSNTWILSSDESNTKVWAADSQITYLEISGDDVLLMVAPNSTIADTVRNAILP